MNHLLIAAIPRTGSTFIIRNLTSVLPYAECPPRIHTRKGVPLTMESDLYPQDWESFAEQNTVGKLHCRATSQNLQILQQYRVKVVFLYRNMADVVVSLRDHHDTGHIGQARSLFAGDWNNMTAEQQHDGLIDFYVPRFLFMYVTWMRAVENNSVPILPISYEEIRTDPDRVFSRITNFAGIEEYSDKFRGLRPGPNFNKGVSGRGRQMLTQAQLERINRMTSYFTDIDMAGVR